LRNFLSLLAAFGALFPAALMAQDHSAYRLLKLDGMNVKWGDPVHGAGASMTYAFIDRNTAFEDARNCRSMGPVRPILTANGIENPAFKQAAAAAFATWEAIAGVRFEKAATPETADILIGADLSGAGWAFADVKWSAPAADGSMGVITRGLVCLNAAKPWKIGFGHNAEAQDLKYTLTHEIGHAIGLNHASPYGQVMSFIYGEEFHELQPGDIAGARALYGEPELTSTSALGPAAGGDVPLQAN